MVRIYLDIETYRQRKDDAFLNEKVIAIGLLEDWTPYRLDSLNKQAELKLLTEWELTSEKKVISGFYEYINKVLTCGARFIVIVGFNILRMDIPLLIQKGFEYGVASIDKLNLIWHNTFTIDLFQLLLPANKCMFEGLRLSTIVKVISNKLREVDLLYMEEHGEKVKEAYEKGEYEKIEEWLKQDLNIIRYLDLSNTITKLIELSVREDKALFKER